MMIGILIPFLILIPTPVLALSDIQESYNILNHWQEMMYDYHLRKKEPQPEPEYIIDDALKNYGHHDSTESEELLQLPSSID